MSAEMQNAAKEFWEALAGEVEPLVRTIRSMSTMTKQYSSGAFDQAAAVVAMAGDPVPTAALLLRISKLRREAAEAGDRLRLAMIQAARRAELASEGGEDE